MLQFHAIGQWRRDQVVVEPVPSSQVLPNAVRRLIDQAWVEATAQANVHLFDGPMVRWEGLAASPQRLVMRISQTSYKQFFGTNMRHPELAERYGARVLANPVGLSAALVSNDGFLLLGRRNSRVAYYPNRLHPFAGALEPVEAGDPFAGIERELREELGLAAEDLREIACLGVVEDVALRQGEMIFRVAARLGCAAILARLDAREHRSGVALPAEQSQIEALLGQAGQLTPVGVATVLLWARPLLGETWFADWQTRICANPAGKRA